MGLHRNTAAGLPYPCEHHTPTIRAEQRGLSQRLLGSQYNYPYDEDLALPHYGHAHRGRTQRPADLGIANRDRGFCPPSETYCNDLDSLEPGRHRPYHGSRLSDSDDEKFDFDRHGHRLSRGPTSYHAADDRSLFACGTSRGRGFGHSELPPYPSDMETRGFDEEIFRRANPNLRYSRPRPGSVGGHDMRLDCWVDPGTGYEWCSDPAIYGLDHESDLAPRRDGRDFGRVGARAAGRYDPDYHFDDDFEDDDIVKNFGETRRPRHAGFRLNLDPRFDDDNTEDDILRERRASIVARSRHREIPVQRHGGRFSDGVNSEDWGREREDSQAQEEDSDIGKISERPLGTSSQVPCATRHRHTAQNFDNDAGESLRGEPGHAFRPRRAGHGSALDRFIVDESEDEFIVDESEGESSGDFRASIAAERRHRPHIVQRHVQMDAEHWKREWDRKKAAWIKETYAKTSRKGRIPALSHGTDVARCLVPMDLVVQLNSLMTLSTNLHVEGVVVHFDVAKEGRNKPHHETHVSTSKVLSQHVALMPYKHIHTTSPGPLRKLQIVHKRSNPAIHTVHLSHLPFLTAYTLSLTLSHPSLLTTRSTAVSKKLPVIDNKLRVKLVKQKLVKLLTIALARKMITTALIAPTAAVKLPMKTRIHRVLVMRTWKKVVAFRVLFISRCDDK